MALLTRHDGLIMVQDQDTDDDLSYDQIQSLLKETGARLQENAALNIQSRDSDSTFRFPKLSTGALAEPYVKNDNGVARIDTSRLVKDQERQLADKPRKIEDPIQSAKKNIEEKKATAGPKWFDLPRTDLTPELRRDLQLLKMRNVLDPKRHYKKENSKTKAPEYSQVGTIIEGPTEFYSARLTNRERKRTLVEEVLAGETMTKRFKRKYDEIQTAKTSGKKAYYKALKAKRERNPKR